MPAEAVERQGRSRSAGSVFSSKNTLQLAGPIQSLKLSTPMADDTTRRTAHQIFEKVEQSATDELERSSRALAFSGVAGGMGMGLTGLAVATVQGVVRTGRWQDFVALLFFPLGFVTVVIGRAQLFTENTLFPAALVLSEPGHRSSNLRETARLWTVVFIANIAGAILFAGVTMKTGALSYDISIRLAALGMKSVVGSSSHIFWS